MKHRTKLVFALTALLAVVAGNVSAQLPEIRSIFQTSATSRCIGKPKTPLCAVETFIASWVRRDRPLCEMVGKPDLSFGDAANAVSGAEYFVRKTFTIRAEDIPAYWYQPGMVDIELEIRDCFTEGPVCTGSDWLIYSGSLKRVGELWQIVGWSAVTKAFVE
jgi:hypothetical protein